MSEVVHLLNALIASIAAHVVVSLGVWLIVSVLAGLFIARLIERVK